MTDLFDHANRNEPPAGVPPDVCELFEGFALDLAKRGITRYSADAILHRIRWEMHVERGIRDYKCNDHWTAPLSRWFMAKHPQRAGFFETRVRKSVEEN